MYITVNQLANKINNLERFTIDELKQEQPEKYVFEIEILDDYNNIIYRHYKETTEDKIGLIAENTKQFYKDLDKTNYTSKILKLKKAEE